MMTSTALTPSSESYQTGSMPDIFQLIGVLDRKLKTMQTQTLRITGLTPPQFYILTLLIEKNSRPFKELADQLHCTRPTVTGIIDTMQKKGLVKRLPNPSDRRSLLVELTAEGQALVSGSIAHMGDSFCNCCDVLDPEEASQLSRLLRKLDSTISF